LAATVGSPAALPDRRRPSGPMPPMLEFERRPTRSRSLRRAYRAEEGHRQGADGAGLGIEIESRVLRKYKVA